MSLSRSQIWHKRVGSPSTIESSPSTECSS